MPDLSRRFGVTEDCIRKDLKQLVAEGKCKRVYGGATRADGIIELAVRDRMDLFKPEKQLVAQKALALISRNDTVYLDISTTNVLLAKLIAGAQLACTVVTPMVDILLAAAESPSVTVICPGGQMSGVLNGMTGQMAAEALDRFRFDLGFLGAYGVDADNCEVTTHDAPDGLMKRMALERSSRRYVLCESRKLGAVGNYCYASFDDFDALICDDRDEANIARVREAGLEVL